MRASEFVSEEWSAKYKRSIDCSHPKGFSQRAHCAGRKKNEDLNEFAPSPGYGDDDNSNEGSWDDFFAIVMPEMKKLGFATSKDPHHNRGPNGTLLFKVMKPPLDWRAVMFKLYDEDPTQAYWKIVDGTGGETKLLDHGLADLNTQGAAFMLAKVENVLGLDESQLNEFAPASNPGGGNYLLALASAWYNGTFNTGDLHKGIKSQEDVEKILARGIHCGDGKVRKYSIGYNSGFDGVEIQSDDHYEYSDYDDAGRDIDSRTGKPWGPYDVVEFSDSDLSESINENSETDAVFEIDTEDAYNAVMAKFGTVIEWSGNYMVVPRMYWPAIEELAYEAGGEAIEVGNEQLDELTFKGSPCTKDCSGHRAGYEWSQRKGGVDAASWSPSFNTGASLFKNGY